ncbi:SDR family NAD(P)-dependent oxidoreductase [Spiribacter onubensis]|uniref:Glucose 1-dehydrogenase n=1 Tax=Spiribacter onubensis TaxID=3122420 RepID=A0ABV3SAK9_9GAMM
MTRLEGKGIIVTGGASGIGEATVRRIIEEGGRVVIADLDREQGEALAKELGEEQAKFVETDVADTPSVESLFRTTADFCGVDGVFNNAGIGAITPSADCSDDDWQKVIDINLTGVFKVARQALQIMQKQGHGSIVNCASILGHLGQSQTPAYSAAKGGVLNFTRTLAVETALDGVRVNSISPGYIQTPMLDVLDEESLEGLKQLHAMKRLGRPEEIAAATVFLLSDEASFITGADLLVDGGFTAGKS